MQGVREVERERRRGIHGMRLFYSPMNKQLIAVALPGGRIGAERRLDFGLLPIFRKTPTA